MSIFVWKNSIQLSCFSFFLSFPFISSPTLLSLLPVASSFPFFSFFRTFMFPFGGDDAIDVDVCLFFRRERTNSGLWMHLQRDFGKYPLGCGLAGKQNATNQKSCQKLRGTHKTTSKGPWFAIKGDRIIKLYRYRRFSYGKRWQRFFLDTSNTQRRDLE